MTFSGYRVYQALSLYMGEIVSTAGW